MCDNFIVQRTTLRTRRKLRLRWMKANDPLVPTVLDFLRIHFHPKEPVNRSIDLMNTPQDVITLDVFCQMDIKHNASVVALNETGEVVGVLVNNVLKRGEDESDAKEEGFDPSPRYAKFMDLLSSVRREMRLFEKYPDVRNVLDHAILAVSGDWQGDGISQFLVEYTNTILAKEFKCDLAFVICSSFFSARVFDKAGYKEIWSMKFRDCVEDGQVLFPTEPPHDYMTCKLLELR